MTIFEQLANKDHEQVDFFYDRVSGLKAIVAVHDTQLGPAVGGVRMYPYATEEEALTDVLRLSRGMTYKSAITGLNFGGGKAVIIGDPKQYSSEMLFRTFGRFVHGLSGRYITAEDVGTNVQCMEWIRIETKYVVGLPTYLGGLGDPSPVTAHGVIMALRAAVKKSKGIDELSGLKVAVQGLGHVGYYMCKELYEAGATLYVTDVSEEAIQRVVTEFKATAVKPDEIYTLDVDVFSPCAMSMILNDQTIPQLKCSIIAGAANAQLEDEQRHALMLKERGILWLPGYVVNAGGLIDVASEYFNAGRTLAWEKTEEIYHTVWRLLEQAEKEDIPPLFAANKIVEARIHAVSLCKGIYVRRGKSRR